MASTPTNENQKLEDAARAGWLYYVAGKTQDEIAKQLNTSRQSAQRLVALAVSQGLIKVRLEHPIRHCMELADALQRQYGLAQCEVVPSVSDDPNSTIGLAQAGAAEIERHLKHRQSKIIAFGTGRVLRAVRGVGWSRVRAVRDHERRLRSARGRHLGPLQLWFVERLHGGRAPDWSGQRPAL